MSPNKMKATIVHDEKLKRFQTEDGKHYVQYQISSNSKVMEIVREYSSKHWIGAIYKAIDEYNTAKGWTINPTGSYNYGWPRVNIRPEKC